MKCQQYSGAIADPSVGIEGVQLNKTDDTDISGIACTSTLTSLGYTKAQ